MTTTAATPRAYDPIDLSSRAFWSTSAQEREQGFGAMVEIALDAAIA